MIKVSVLYPRTEGFRFDHDYYRDRHMPMVADKVDAVTSWGVERSLGDDAPFVAACWFIADSAQAWEASFGPVSGEIFGDIPNYTDIQPILHIGEITAQG